MAKIPVGKTISYAYSFTFGNFLTVVGLAWFPLLLVGIGAYLALPPYFAGLQAMMATQDPTKLSSAGGYMLLFMIVMFMSFNMIYVAVARQALGLRTGPAFFYFSLDRAFWRLLGAYLLMFLIVMGVMIAGGIVFGVLAGILVATVGQGVAAGAAGVTGAVVLVGLTFFLMFRLLFFMAPVTVAEGHRVLRRSWTLSGGNFWRIFAVLLAIMVPLIIVEIVLEVVIFGFVSLGPLRPNASPQETIAFYQQIGAQLYGMLPFLAPVAIVLYAVVIGLLISASSFAYRALVPATEGVAAEFA